MATYTISVINEGKFTAVVIFTARGKFEVDYV